MLLDEQNWLENLAFVVSPETVNKREENAFFSSLQRPQRYDERGEILVLIN